MFKIGDIVTSNGYEPIKFIIQEKNEYDKKFYSNDIYYKVKRINTEFTTIFLVNWLKLDIETTREYKINK
jgi:small-conductance mechanosensitive channel